MKKLSSQISLADCSNFHHQLFFFFQNKHPAPMMYSRKHTKSADDYIEQTPVVLHSQIDGNKR